MAIKVNYAADRIVPPTIVLRGFKVNETTGVVSNRIQDFTIDQLDTTTDINVTDHTEVTNRGLYAFLGDVQVSFVSDPKFTANTYGGLHPDEVFIGKRDIDKDEVNSTSETYYTINGKDPVRTKANLYTHHFRVRRNLSGTDNIILKAKTYVNGLASEVSMVEFRILKENEKRV